MSAAVLKDHRRRSIGFIWCGVIKPARSPPVCNHHTTPCFEQKIVDYRLKVLAALDRREVTGHQVAYLHSA